MNGYFLFSYLIGRTIVNVVPWPFSVTNVISPSKCARIVEYDINNPSPVPFFPFVVIISLNNFFLTKSGSPPAKSVISIFIALFS